MADEPGAHLGVLVGGVVIDDGVNEFPGWHRGLDLVEEADEFLMAVALHVRPITVPSSTLSVANTVVVPCRM